MNYVLLSLTQTRVLTSGKVEIDQVLIHGRKVSLPQLRQQMLKHQEKLMHLALSKC